MTGVRSFLGFPWRVLKRMLGICPECGAYVGCGAVCYLCKFKRWN